MDDGSRLRPLERRVLRLTEQGIDDVEIAWRFRRTPRFIRQVRDLAGVERAAPVAPLRSEVRLRPIERRVLRWRDQGLSHEELSPRFRRTPAFLEQVERLARHKLAS